MRLSSNFSLIKFKFFNLVEHIVAVINKKAEKMYVNSKALFFMTDD